MSVVQGGYRVLFEPEARAYDEVSETPGEEYRRKVRTLAGNYQLLSLRPDLLDPRMNRLLWQFLSHKVLRLALPWLLLMLVVTSGLLSFGSSEQAIYRAAFAGQLVFYLMAASGLERLRLRVRWLSIPYAFAILNLAAASSLFTFLLGRGRAAWRGRAP